MKSQLNPQTSRVRLVIADVDGTLVTQDKVLTARATEAVKKLRDAGILFGITSGRPPKGMKMLIEPLQLTEPLADDSRLSDFTLVAGPFRCWRHG